jgi:hypothetical protein
MCVHRFHRPMSRAEVMYMSQRRAVGSTHAIPSTDFAGYADDHERLTRSLNFHDRQQMVEQRYREARQQRKWANTVTVSRMSIFLFPAGSATQNN